MIVTRGLGSPGGLITSFGLGRGVAIVAGFRDIIQVSVEIIQRYARSVEIHRFVRKTIER